MNVKVLHVVMDRVITHLVATGVLVMMDILLHLITSPVKVSGDEGCTITADNTTCQGKLCRGVYSPSATRVGRYQSRWPNVCGII